MKSKTKLINFTAPVDLAERLAESASANYQTVSEVMRAAAHEYVKEHEQKQKETQNG